jgi:nicotinamidase-related amidase
MAARGLIHGPLPPRTTHICVDMQKLFANGSPWEMPWAEKVLPAIEELIATHSDQTVFTRFIPAKNATAARGMWSSYYERWSNITLDRIEPSLLELLQPLQRFIPSAQMVDKHVYSPWTAGDLDRLLKAHPADALVITGGETDVCVLATVLGAVDRGFRVVLVKDALCSSVDETHDALMTLYSTRFSEQIEAVELDEVLEGWRR